MNQIIFYVEKFSELDNFSKQINLFDLKEDKKSKIIENKIKCIINMRLMVDFAKQLKHIILSSNCDRLKNLFRVFFNQFFFKIFQINLFFVFKNYYEDAKFDSLSDEINEIIEEPTFINKSSLSLKINKCFAIKVFFFYFHLKIEII